MRPGDIITLRRGFIRIRVTPPALPVALVIDDAIHQVRAREYVLMQTGTLPPRPRPE